MASFTLFEKPLFTGLRPEDTKPSNQVRMVDPIAGVQWQVLTSTGLRLSCTSFDTLLNSKHPEIPLRAVSHNGGTWRSYKQFRSELARGVRPEIAVENARWMGEE